MAKILVGCEESQAVTIEFRKLGHDAYSCDILPCSGGHPEWHIQGDILLYLGKNEYNNFTRWDLLIGHPPCTYFSQAGMHYLKTQEGRIDKLNNSFQFLLKLWNAPIDMICIENPVGWLSTNWKKPDQIVQPYMFGHKELKTTCLWLKGLPKLEETNNVGRPVPDGYCIRKSGKNKGKRYNYYWRQGKSAKLRSKTFSGIAKAMAEQWG